MAIESKVRSGVASFTRVRYRCDYNESPQGTPYRGRYSQGFTAKVSHRRARVQPKKWTERDALKDFRFTLPDLVRVARLCFSNEIFRTFRRRYSLSCSVEIMCILLRPLAIPCLWEDLERDFGRHSPALCKIFYESVDELLKMFGASVLTFQKDLILSRAAE